MASSVYDFSAVDLSGRDAPLEDYRGKVLLIVNTASKCGFTPQYDGLEALHRELSPRGFAVLGFPCNQFAGQEPGSAGEIATFCSTTYGVTFPLFEKIDVNGPDRHPIYGELTKATYDDGEGGDIKWNFEKFLIGRNGEIVARFTSNVDPESKEMTDAIEKELAKK